MKGKICFICRDNSLCLDIMKNNPGVKAVTTCEYFHLKFDGNELSTGYSNLITMNMIFLLLKNYH